MRNFLKNDSQINEKSNDNYFNFVILSHYIQKVSHFEILIQNFVISHYF